MAGHAAGGNDHGFLGANVHRRFRTVDVSIRPKAFQRRRLTRHDSRRVLGCETDDAAGSRFFTDYAGHFVVQQELDALGASAIFQRSDDPCSRSVIRTFIAGAFGPKRMIFPRR